MQKYISYTGQTLESKTSDAATFIKKILWKLFCLSLFVVIICFLFFSVLRAINFKSNFLLEVRTNFEDDSLVYKNIIARLQGQYIWNVKVKNLRAELLASTKLKDLEVKIQLPNKLFISASKRLPYAVWWNYKNFFVVDDEGVILSEHVTEEDKKKYMLVVGNNALEELKEISKILNDSKLKIASMRLVNSRRWDLVLDNGIMIKLPEKNELSAIKLFHKLLKQNPKLVSDKAVIDMRISPDTIFIKNNGKI